MDLVRGQVVPLLLDVQGNDARVEPRLHFCGLLNLAPVKHFVDLVLVLLLQSLLEAFDEHVRGVNTDGIQDLEPLDSPDKEPFAVV